MIDKNIILDAALHTAEWFVANQVHNRLDANSGRFPWSTSLEKGVHSMTTGWDSGCSLMGLLAAWKRTGYERYLQAAERAGHYIMSLQIMDPRMKLYYGAFREVTPQSTEFCPRDSASAAWALTWLYNATKNPEYLDRAVIYGNWLMEYGMFEGWPRWAVLTDGQDHFYGRGSFQSGCGLFFYDLFKATHDLRYIERGMKPIAEIYCRDFIREDGSVIVRREIFTNAVSKSKHKAEIIELGMHNFNDDFGAAMLMQAADLFGKEEYNEYALRFARYLMRVQDADGNFGKGRFPSAVPQALMYFHDLGIKYNDDELLAARDRTLEALLAMQFKNTGSPLLDGAFPAEEHPGEKMTGTRATMYALSALLHVESDQSGVWLGRHNEPFRDPLSDPDAPQPVFTW